MSMAIKNIFKLIKVQTMQKRNMLFFYAGFVAAIKIISLVGTFAAKGNIYFLTDLNSNTLYFTLLFIPLLALSTSNVLTNNELKMYPGTVRTRYISRLLTDHLFIVLSYFILLVINILSEIVILVIKSAGQKLGTCLLFDIKYWLIGLVVYVSLASLIYMAIVLVNTYATVLPNVVNILIVTGVVAIWRIFPDDMIDLTSKFFRFLLATNIGLHNLAFRALLIWTILVLLGLAGTFITKVWKEEFSRVKNFALICVNISVCLYIIIASVSCEIENEPPQELQTNDKTMYIDIPKGIDMNNYEETSEIKHNYENSIFTTDYESLAIFSEYDVSNIPDGQVDVTIFAEKITINNINISKKIVDNTELDIANSKLINTNGEEYYVINNFLGNLYKYTKEYDYTNDYYSGYYDYTNFILTARIIYK